METVNKQQPAENSWSATSVHRVVGAISSEIITRPHRLHAVPEMRHIATDVARSVVCVPVCLCWALG